jgi:O-antigen/teichoic acid export membrane protein
LLAAITVGSNFLQYTFLTTFAITRYPHAMSVGLGSRKVLREILSFGTGSMLLMAADRIQRQSVPLLIAQFNSLGSVVFFAIPNRLVDYAKNLGLAASTPFAPVYGHLHAKGDLSAQQKAWFALTHPMQFVVLGSALMVLGLGRPFVSLWMGPSFAENGQWVLVFLGLSLMMEGISPNSGRYLIGTGRHRFPAIFLFVWSLFALVPILIGARAAGVGGAALGAAFASVVSSAVTWIAACRALGIRSKVHLHRTFSCWLSPVLITWFTLAAMRHVCGVSDYGRLALCAIVGILAYVLSSWTFALDRTERIEFTMGLRRALSGMLTAWQGQ